MITYCLIFQLIAELRLWYSVSVGWLHMAKRRCHRAGTIVVFWSPEIRNSEPCPCICPKLEPIRRAQAPGGTAIAYCRQCWN